MGFANVRASRYGMRECSGGCSSTNAGAGAGLNEYHTYAVYRNTCRGLFQRHKLLFSFLMCCRIKLNAGTMAPDELDFFLR